MYYTMSQKENRNLIFLPFLQVSMCWQSNMKCEVSSEYLFIVINRSSYRKI